MYPTASLKINARKEFFQFLFLKIESQNQNSLAKTAGLPVGIYCIATTPLYSSYVKTMIIVFTVFYI